MSQRDKSALCCIMEMPHPHDERRSNLPLKQTLSRHWFRFQRELFPWLEEALGPLDERYERLVRVVELVRVEEWLPYSRGWRGRPLKDRAALARAFLAKAVLDVPTTRGLVERLRTEGLLRRLCGWEAAGGVPSEATFSRAGLRNSPRATCRGACMRRCSTERWRATWRATCRGTRPPSGDENRRRPSPPPRPSRSADGVGRARTSYGRRSRAGWSGRRR